MVRARYKRLAMLVFGYPFSTCGMTLPPWPFGGIPSTVAVGLMIAPEAGIPNSH